MSAAATLPGARLTQPVPRLQSLDRRPLDDWLLDYDLLIGTLGYEARSTYVCSRLVGSWANALLVGHPRPMDLALKVEAATEELLRRSVADAQRAGAEVVSVEDRHFGDMIRRRVESMPIHGKPVRLLLDVSAMSRIRMARSLSAISSLPVGSTCDIVYAPAGYSASAGDVGPIDTNEPLPGFAGWNTTPDVGLAMIIGLGFESELALGALDYHEPAEVWCFLPGGVDSRYDSTTAEMNAPLLALAGERQTVHYDVTTPFATALGLMSIIRSVDGGRRPLVVPLGAKSFCLASLAVSVLLNRRLPVWHVSGGPAPERGDREPSGQICGIRIVLDLPPNADESDHL